MSLLRSRWGGGWTFYLIKPLGHLGDDDDGDDCDDDDDDDGDDDGDAIALQYNDCETKKDPEHFMCIFNRWALQGPLDFNR